MSISLQSQNDFFPLKIGNQWNYSYKSIERQFFDISFMNQMTTDSGSVQYSILDSSLQDSLIIWIVQEKDVVERRIQDYYDSTDTTFLINVNETFHILEYLDSAHTIKSESNYEVFTFPIKWERFGGLISSTQVTRYGADSSILIIEENKFLIANYSDSLNFHKDVGLVYAQCVIDKGPNTPYYYKWKASLSSFLTSVGNVRKGIPQSFTIYQNFPNPFNSTSVIRYSIPKSSQVKLKIFNVLGQEVETLVNEEKSAGTYEVNWNATNLPSGVYFYRLQSGSFDETKKMILLK